MGKFQSITVTWIYNKGDTYTIVDWYTHLENNLLMVSEDHDVYSTVYSNSTFVSIHSRIGLVQVYQKKGAYKSYGSFA